ncbi:hypothetical protein [Paenibacillus oryzisoli]|uniref:Glycosyl hydrolases family 2 sugar binding domain-containing protein n=1 Tax=Paenibacillus oryzisoli TaxID=1850517 RepID=A0A197ZWN0_9BACL|nr:hypothetical protein [Paenibacillus oryzisoli]OAS13227.1 hypothetical protein A8708_33115 [Paenibacillus oryzisoli]
MKKNTQIISTDGSWVNALENEPIPAWAQPKEGEAYVWGASDPLGPAAVVAKTFTVHSKHIEKATLFLAVDNYAIVLINGVPVVIDPPQDTLAFYNPGRTFHIEPFLQRGENNIVIAGFNSPSNANRSVGNPAGILARIEIDYKHHHH